MRKRKGAFVRKRVKASFDPKVFLAKVGEGKTVSKYRKDQIVFSQGQVADSVFYIQQGLQGQLGNGVRTFAVLYLVYFIR